jgi:heme-degrading monooxygenase HmoA
MLCAHTVRKLKPGTFEQFAEAFRPDQGSPPPGWIRFNMLRSLADENEVVTFGFFDGTVEDLEASQGDHGYRDRVAAVAPFVDEVVVNGLYEIVVDFKAEGATA